MAADGSPRAAARAVATLGCLLAVACGDSASELSRRILERHREAARVKPLPASGVLIIALAAAGDREAASGTAEIAWEGQRYRETVTSAGVSVVRGIQGGKAYLTDEDGVTRVGSEPMLRELLTRSYFWRRAYLFEDRERARLSLGPGDDRTVSVQLQPSGGNPLLLKFGRKDGQLAAALSPRLRLEFTAPGAFRDSSSPAAPVAGVVRWSGLPTGVLPDERVGGGRATFSAEAPGAGDEAGSGAPLLWGRLNGIPVRIRLDAAVEGPVRLSPELAARLGLAFTPDVHGRALARGVRLEVPGIAFPALTVERSEAIAQGADAQVGAALFRESVVEWEPGRRVVRFHDPERWVPPENLARILVDDDGNRPVVTLLRGGDQARVALGAETGGPALLLAAPAARRCGVTQAAPAVAGFRWGVLDFPPLSVGIDPEGFFPDWGDDGRLGWEGLARYHFYLDMSHRWIYVRPIPAAPAG